MKNAKSNTKERLLNHAAQIFALKGYHQATTREICKASEINITAIHYYFNDKAGLYRAVIAETFAELPRPEIGTPVLLNCNSIHDAMVKFYTILLRPFLATFEEKNFPPKRFHFVHNIITREQFEPTGLIDDLILIPANAIHVPLNAILCRYLNVQTMTDEIHRLSFTLTGIGFSLIHPRHIVNHMAPNLLAEPEWQEKMITRLADYAVAIINSEATKSQ